jgi:hypothetical protein
MSAHTILGRWYAEPLTPTQAQDLLDASTSRLEVRLRHGGGTLGCRLAQMQARFWLGRSIEEDYRSLRHLAGRSAHGRALLELVYGQLLASRRMSDATTHLQRGFELARPLFAPGDYFQVLERHRLLQLIPLSDTPAVAEPLEQLLTTARVIERLERPEQKRGHYVFDKHDTYG